MKVKFKRNGQTHEGTVIWVSKHGSGYVIKDSETLTDILNPEILEEIE